MRISRCRIKVDYQPGAKLDGCMRYVHTCDEAKVARFCPHCFVVRYSSLALEAGATSRLMLRVCLLVGPRAFAITAQPLREGEDSIEVGRSRDEDGGVRHAMKLVNSNSVGERRLASRFPRSGLAQERGMIIVEATQSRTGIADKRSTFGWLVSWDAQIGPYGSDGRLWRPLDLVVFNPRRRNFPMNDPNASYQQILWEHEHLRQATAIWFWFPKETLCAIAPLRTGELGPRTRRCFRSGCIPKYQRRMDVEIKQN